jgi:Domain of unknown function (DUF6089)
MKVIFSNILLIMLALHLQAQNMRSIGKSTFICFQGGPSKYLGDIGGHPSAFNEILRLDKNTFFYGLSIQRFHQRKFNYELAINAGKLAASDADIKYTSTLDPEFLRHSRNLDFRTNLVEVSATAHFYPLQFLNKKTKVYNLQIQPFVFIGAGYFSFNPQGSYYDDVFKQTIWVDLAPLHTEGQTYAEYPGKKEYALQQINIPYGYGLTYFVADNFFISLSMNNRKLFTDYLDDVSGTFIDPSIHNNYITDPESLEIAKIMSDKSYAVNPFVRNYPGDVRGNVVKADSFYNYNLKIGFRLGRKLSKKSDFFKFDETEKCE